MSEERADYHPMTDKHGLIYLASPYSHPDPAVQEYRFRVVCRVAARLMREGHLIYSPIAHTHPIAVADDLPKDFAYWERYDKAHMKNAAEIWVLCMEGWMESRGVRAELVYMLALGKRADYIWPTTEDLAVMREVG